MPPLLYYSVSNLADPAVSEQKKVLLWKTLQI